MKRIIALALAGVLIFTAQADPGANDAAYWGNDCTKVDEGTGSDALVADADYRLVVLKSGTVNDEFYNVEAGDTLRTVSGKDISHYILCDGHPDATTTTTVDSTTTTVATTTSSTTTTAPPTTSLGSGPSTSTPTTTVHVDPPETEIGTAISTDYPLIPIKPSTPATPITATPQFTG